MKYKNLTVLFKDDPNCEDDICGTHKVEFRDAVLVLSGDHLIITEHNKDGSIIGRVFPLKMVDSYKTGKE